MEKPAIHAGGCLCGAIRYEVGGPALQTSVCHCEDCRRARGAPFIAWTFFDADRLPWTHGAPKSIVFAGRERFFCGDCGTPLRFQDPDYPNLCELSTCSLDDPSPFPPGDQCWVEDEIPWVEKIPRLPRFQHTSPIPGET